MKKALKIVISALCGICFFVCMMPFQFDMYIPVFHSAVSMALFGITGLLFAITLYKFLAKTLFSGGVSIIVYFLILLAIAHGIYTAMFWSSLICLVIIVILLIIVGITYIKNKTRRG